MEMWTTGRVIRLNMNSDINVAYSKELSVIDLPTFVLFDASGSELQRWVGEAPALAALKDNIDVQKSFVPHSPVREWDKTFLDIYR